MTSHRRAPPISHEILPASQPFSSFDFIKERFSDLSSIRRLFSLARSFGMQTLVVEKIPAVGIIRSENEEIREYYDDYRMGGLTRLSFWKRPLPQLQSMRSGMGEDLIGYAILKQDIVPSKDVDRWHVFEAVFRKYAHPHNCVSNPKDYTLAIGENEFSLPGVLYCQQNGLNKVCAQVALRTLLSRRPGMEDISYKKINDLAAPFSTVSPFHPSNGLNVPQIRAILSGLGVSFFDIHYFEKSLKFRKNFPFQKLLYAGVESGNGALLGFHFSGPRRMRANGTLFLFTDIPFNKDTWAPDADFSYFKVGADFKYIPSESWTSSFLGHDDNFGANFCVPRLYIQPEQVEYVVELSRDGVAFSGTRAETVSIFFLYLLFPYLKDSSNKWLRRLTRWADPEVQQVVLRAQSVDKGTYLGHLETNRDWEGNRELSSRGDLLEKVLPDMLWVVEISLPHLFPANERKLGEIVLNAVIPPDLEKRIDFRPFILVRLPAHYFFMKSSTQEEPDFVQLPSAISSHMPLMRCD